MLNFNITPDTYKGLSDTLAVLKDISNGGNIAVQYSALYSGALEHLYQEGVEQATEFKNEFAPEDVVLFSKLLGVLQSECERVLEMLKEMTDNTNAR